MNKEEFRNLAGTKQVRIMSKLCKNRLENKEKIAQLKDWFEDILIEKKLIKTDVGWYTSKELEEMNYDANRELFIGEERERTNQKGNREKYTVCPDANNFFMRRKSQSISLRKWTETNSPGYTPKTIQESIF